MVARVPERGIHCLGRLTRGKSIVYCICYNSMSVVTNKYALQWLKTDLGTQQADLEPEIGAKEVIRITREAGPESTGKFMNLLVPGWEDKLPNNYDGKEVPW